jgi:acetoin:2,6-dichlorophenolindophenol oxidoreductase subunit beta
MGTTVGQTIQSITRRHLRENNGLLFGQCVTAVGWIGGTVPEMTEAEGIVELSMADVAGAGIAVGVALMGRRPIYVIRYQGFMWYDAAPLLNYAAKSKEMWKVPCPLFVRSLAMEGGIGPVASAAHHGMVMRMPGMPVVAPMTPKEWAGAWEWFMSHDDPLYVSEHRRSIGIDYEMDPVRDSRPDITLLAISAGRLNALEAASLLAKEGIRCDVLHLVWLKPFCISDEIRQSLRGSGLGLVIDSDYEIAGASRSIAYEVMHAVSCPVFAMGLEDRTAGFAPRLDNPTPPASKIAERVKALLAHRNSASGSLQEPFVMDAK